MEVKLNSIHKDHQHTHPGKTLGDKVAIILAYYDQQPICHHLAGRVEHDLKKLFHSVGLIGRTPFEGLMFSVHADWESGDLKLKISGTRPIDKWAIKGIFSTIRLADSANITFDETDEA